MRKDVRIWNCTLKWLIPEFAGSLLCPSTIVNNVTEDFHDFLPVDFIISLFFFFLLFLSSSQASSAVSFTRCESFEDTAPPARRSKAHVWKRAGLAIATPVALTPDRRVVRIAAYGPGTIVFLILVRSTQFALRNSLDDVIIGVSVTVGVFFGNGCVADAAQVC